MKKEKALLQYLQQFLTDSRIEQFEKVLQHRTNHFTVVLENIYQQHNSNAVIRSCDCFGIQTCHIVEEHYKFEVARGVNKGATKWVNVEKYATTEAAIESIKAKGYQIVATSPHEGSTSLADFDVTKKSAFFFGAEKKGLSKTVMKNADELLHIPMVGHTESLNISVSAAIILQKLSTDLRKIDFAWQLTDEEKDLVRLKWTKVSTKRLPTHLKHFEYLYKQNHQDD
jgi:tRNA (guanosine-2'-O-)-methyltransferase